MPPTPPLPPPDPDDHLDLRWRRGHLVTSRMLTWPHARAGTAGVSHHLHVALDGGLRLTGGPGAGGPPTGGQRAGGPGTGGLGTGGPGTGGPGTGGPPTDTRLTGADVEVALRPAPGGLPPGLVEQDGFRHLTGRPAFHLDVEVADEWLAGQLAVTARDGRGRVLAATGVQTALAIDERFATDQPLGVRWDAQGRPTCTLWAPTARSVHLHLHLADGATGRGHDDGNGDGNGDRHRRAHGAEQVLSLTRGREGLWTVVGHPSWAGRAYRFEVEAYDPGADRIVRHLVTDPWSVGLTADSERSVLLDLDDLDDPELAPPGWSRGTTKPAFAGHGRMVAYELHVRDFSAADESVPTELRGTYAAFTLPGSHGTRHLRTLAEAGVSHLHLLPINDLASIPERRADQITPSIATPADPASPAPQAEQQASADRQPYNWGYDPLHWLVPEGSYASEPDGPARTREVRELVAAVNRLGLRVVLDVVYNHTYRAGDHPLSVLDRIVPGYFHRLDDLGRVTTSTCCPNTATEHAMMDRLIVDAVITWARAYRVDGFRFDLLGHHPAAQARRIRAALDRLTLERDGVDGRSMVLYGEGWEFGEVAGDARFVQATQHSLAGSGIGIGTFDDRLRDAVRGGSHVGPRSAQGFASGLWWEPNGRARAAGREGGPQPTAASDAGSEERVRALELTDRVRLGVAGNLAELDIPCHDGVLRRGSQLRYGHSPAGYAAVPSDQVAYVSAHDNETLFDALAAKLPVATSMEDRVRMQVVALATVLLGQGMPFLHAGSELLRSKSLDRDSYRSGDWFNAIDWTASSSRWGVGLPPESSNPGERELLAELLRTIPAPAPEDLARCRERVLELLRVRSSSRLFGLPDLRAVAGRLTFHLTGRDAVPGVVAWALHGSGLADHDLLLVINATPLPLEVDWLALGSGAPAIPGTRSLSERTRPWVLHPLLARSVDPVVRQSRVDGGAICVPARTPVVFRRKAGRG